MMTAAEFCEISKIPQSIEDVIWPDLNADFYSQCLRGIDQLTKHCQANAENLTTFFVGAGISIHRPARLPSAVEAVATLLQECIRLYPALSRYESTLLKVTKQSRYVLMENVFQHLFECVQPEVFHAGNIFNMPSSPPRFNVNHRFLADWIRSARGTVLTPNLDPLIEHAWSLASETPVADLMVARRPEDFVPWEKLIEQPHTLWKLHGSSDDPASWAITLSKVGFQLDESRAGLIDHVVSQHNICFMGYRAADLDLFPPILESHSKQREKGAQLFWVFYFRDGYKTLEDYLQNEPNIAQLYAANTSAFVPIVTTAERLSTWLHSTCLHRGPVFPQDIPDYPPYDYRQWFTADLSVIGELLTRKLVGHTLRTLGEFDEANAIFEDAVNSVMDAGIPVSRIEKGHLRQVTQLLQESALTAQQKGDYATAIARVKRAQQMLRMLGNDNETEFGLVSMLLDAKSGVTWRDRLIGAVRLLRLHWRFFRLHRRRDTPIGFSPVLGQGLCIFYEVKSVERILEKLSVTRFHWVRLSLIRWYEIAGNFIKRSQFLNSMPDVRRRQAFLWAPIDSMKAALTMAESIRIARTVGDAYHHLSLERAQLLKTRLRDADAISRLEDEMKL